MGEGTLRLGLEGWGPREPGTEAFPPHLPLTVFSSFSKSSSSAPMMLMGTRPGRGGPGACGRGGMASAHTAPHRTASQSPHPPALSALSTHRPSGDVFGLHGLCRAGGRGGAGLEGWQRAAQGGYSQIPGPGAKVSKQPPPPLRPPQLNGASVWRQRALQRPAGAGSPRTGSLVGGGGGGELEARSLGL